MLLKRQIPLMIVIGVGLLTLFGNPTPITIINGICRFNNIISP